MGKKKSKKNTFKKVNLSELLESGPLPSTEDILLPSAPGESKDAMVMINEYVYEFLL